MSMKSCFFSPLHPETTCEELFETVSNILGSQCFFCTNVLSKYLTNASFHLAVHVQDFKELDCPDLWPDGCLFRPFFGKPKLDDEYDAAKPSPSQILNKHRILDLNLNARRIVTEEAEVERRFGMRSRRNCNNGNLLTCSNTR